jgi:HPt (histidine-containing phosphotransfer) domain-containing protein
MHEARPPTPIVAVTANARSEDIAASRLAGCDEHLSKPLSKRALLDAIERLAGHATGDSGTEGRILIEVPEGLEDLAPGYLEARRSDVAQAAALLVGDDFGGVRRLAHNMAGSGSSYGFQLVTELGFSLEQSARAGDKHGSEQCLDSLRDYLDRVHLVPTQ